MAVATGEIYDAEAAQRLGLVDAVVPRETFDKEWRALAERMASTAPGTTRAVKSVLAAADPTVRPDLEADATDTFARLWTSDAHWEAVEALERQKR
jgi:enoyl-CoA hydratase/carnithine racemase